MMQVENTYFDLAQSCPQNCLVICDRGLMDGSACKLKYIPFYLCCHKEINIFTVMVVVAMNLTAS
jgi:hypothetical protein